MRVNRSRTMYVYQVTRARAYVRTYYKGRAFRRSSFLALSRDPVVSPRSRRRPLRLCIVRPRRTSTACRYRKYNNTRVIEKSKRYKTVWTGWSVQELLIRVVGPRARRRACRRGHAHTPKIKTTSPIILFGCYVKRKGYYYTGTEAACSARLMYFLRVN